MSYILDALKKSEQERKRDQIPDLQSIQVAVRPFRASSLMKTVFLSVWAVGTLVLIALWLQQKYRVTLEVAESVIPSTVVTPTSVTAIPTVAVEAVSQQPTALPPVEPFLESQSMMDESAVLRDQVDANTSLPVNDEANLESGSEIIRPKTRFDQSTSRPSSSSPVADSHVTESANSVEDFQYLPQLTQMPQAFTASLPKLVFISHLYSNDPASRSVIINDKTWHEHDRISPELQLIAIIPQGVVLSYQGKQFRMLVVDDWSGQ